ncbi:MAG: class I SAM-dependent methyltransferase [Betaproteobacteria bacterium]
MARLLQLRAGMGLLELGAGAGWPGLYLARITGCDVTLMDIPLAGLRIVAERAAAERLAGACRIVAADAAALPVKDAAFDAISHSDLLCCLVAKALVLRECRRVVRSGGSMAFSVISIAPGLSPRDQRQAVEAGPPFKETELPYPALLEQSRWELAGCEDLTSAYARAVREMLREEEGRADALARILGEGEFAERLARRRRTLRAVEAGLLRRELFAVRPALA